MEGNKIPKMQWKKDLYPVRQSSSITIPWKQNQYCYQTATGTATGFFNIYQARDGAVYLFMNNKSCKLSLEQIGKLEIDIFNLEDFIYEDFYKAYNG